MVCTGPALTVESSYEDVHTATSTGKEEQKPVYRRRHSSFHPQSRRKSSITMDGDESLLLKVLPYFPVSGKNSRAD
jgi:adiponectin receptor